MTDPADRRTALLDVNVLIALVDPRHVHHELCHHWFADQGERPWASCAITQNAVLRILGHPRYPNSPGCPAVVSAVDTAQLLDPGGITDAYLLALAVHHRGVLATLDARLNPRSVRHGPEALETLQPQTRR